MDLVAPRKDVDVSSVETTRLVSLLVVVGHPGFNDTKPRE